LSAALDKVKVRLTKLMALAASPNEAEAAAAMRKCNELMDKYDIRYIDVDPITRTIDIRADAVDTSTRYLWEKHLAYHIATALDGTVVIVPKGRDNGESICFVASKTDLTLIVKLFKNLRRTVATMARGYMKKLEQGSGRSTAKIDYCSGLVASIGANLIMLYQQADTTDLIVVKADAIQQFRKESIGSVTMVKTTIQVTDNDSYYHGVIDGNTVTLGK
jgi:hypothetical protein